MTSEITAATRSSALYRIAARCPAVGHRFGSRVSRVRASRPYLDYMEKRDEPVRPAEQDFRHLPPRVTPEEMTTVQPVVQAVCHPSVGTETEWELRKAGG